MASAIYHVTGMTCEHCVRAVSAELTGLAGVSGVSIDLVPGGTSAVTVDLVAGGLSAVTVTSASPLAADALRSAPDEAGDYRLA